MIILLRAFSVSLTVLEFSDVRDRTSLIVTLELTYLKEAGEDTGKVLKDENF